MLCVFVWQVYMADVRLEFMYMAFVFICSIDLIYMSGACGKVIMLLFELFFFFSVTGKGERILM